jgi:hypothetical protein
VSSLIQPQDILLRTTTEKKSELGAVVNSNKTKRTREKKTKKRNKRNK